MAITRLGGANAITGTIPNSVLAAGNVIQVVGTQTSTTFSTSSTSFVDATGFSLSITPSSASNKILISLNFMYGLNASVASACRLLRNTDVVTLGSTTNNLGNVYISHNSTNQGFGTFGINYLDTPNSTSELTYKLQVLRGTGGGTLSINNRNTGSSADERIGSLTLMEIAGWL